MPTSTYSQIPIVISYLQKVRPQSILDVGLGNGKMGFLARDFLDVMLGERHLKKDWKVIIDGIEIFADYIQDHQKAIYNDIYIGDAYEVIDNLGKYDLICLGDVLEHFEKKRALMFMDKCFRHCKGHMLLSIPLGENWKQPELYGNPHEEHLSFWKPEDFEPFSCEQNLLEFPNIGLYGTFLIKKDDYLHHRATAAADRLLAEGRADEALSGLASDIQGLSINLNSELMLVDMLLNRRKIKEARAKLGTLRENFPRETFVKELLQKLSGVR